MWVKLRRPLVKHTGDALAILPLTIRVRHAILLLSMQGYCVLLFTIVAAYLRCFSS